MTKEFEWIRRRFENEASNWKMILLLIQRAAATTKTIRRMISKYFLQLPMTRHHMLGASFDQLIRRRIARGKTTCFYLAVFWTVNFCVDMGCLMQQEAAAAHFSKSGGLTRKVPLFSRVQMSNNMYLTAREAIMLYEVDPSCGRGSSSNAWGLKWEQSSQKTWDHKYC